MHLTPRVFQLSVTRVLILLACVCLSTANAALQHGVSEMREALPPHERVLHVEHGCESLDPRVVNARKCSRLIANLYEPLLRVDQRGQLLPALVERWEQNPEKRTIWLYLRQDRRWSDGVPVTVSDIIAAWQSTIQHKLKAGLSFNALMMIEGAREFAKAQQGSLSGLSALDSHTLMITFEKFDPTFLARLTLASASPIPAHAYQRFGGEWVNQADPPFSAVYRAHRRGVDYHLSPNPYHADRDSLHIERIVASYANDAERRLERLREVLSKKRAPHFFYISDFEAEKIASYLKESAWKVGYSNFSSSRGLLVNTSRLLPELVALLKCAVHTQEYVARYQNKSLTEARVWMSFPKYGALSDTVLPRSTDCSLEARALKAAQSRSENAEQAPLTLISYLQEAEDSRHQAVLNAMLKRYGVSVKAMRLSVADYSRLNRAGRYDLSMFNWSPNVPDPFYSFLIVNRATGWLSESTRVLLNRMIEDAHFFEGEERLHAFMGVEKTMLAKTGLIPLARVQRSYVVHRLLCGIRPHDPTVLYRWLRWCDA